jgi:2'-5' RNA ligase
VARLFAAVLLPADIAGHLDEFLDPIRSARPDLRWQHPAKWHVTLQFLGECGPHEVDRQLERWERRARRGRPFDLNIAGAGTFGKTFVARVLWMGLGGDLAALAKIAAFDQELHVTVARTKERMDLTGVVDEIGRYVGPSWHVDQLAVVESQLLGGRGSRYSPLEFFELGTGFPDFPDPDVADPNVTDE